MWTKLFEQIKPTVLEAGEILLSYWPGSERPSDLGKRAKEDGSVVTKADIASERCILAALKSALPGAQIVAEESSTYKPSEDTDFCFFVDPLDGTRVFSEGGSDFSILIALAQAGRVIGSVMYFPARGLFLNCSRESGVNVERGSIALGVSQNVEPRDECVYWRSFTPNTNLKRSRRFDSGDAFLRLASGELDLMMLKMSRLSVWDVAAPSLLVELSGGRVSNEKGEELRFSGPGLNAETVVVSNGRVHDQGLTLCSE